MRMLELVALGETIAPADFRELMAKVPTSVAVVAGMDDGHPVGLTVGTLASVSLEPPLISIAVARTSESWPRIAPSGVFSVSVLSAEQRHVCAAFSEKGPDKFAAIDWETSYRGQPWIRGSVAHLDCAVDTVIEAGDHVIVLGRVLELAHGEEDAPMVFHRRGLGGVRHDG
jgi:3-hydroxy-9,10-secoandrosta-1,3,5(10)-triene-9,17-dione monooxygenase reductase component